MPAPFNTAHPSDPTSPSEFMLSIEPTDGKAFLHTYTLGTDESLARGVAEDIFKHRDWWPTHGVIIVRTVALFRDGKMVDVYDGQWNSEVDAWDDEERTES